MQEENKEQQQKDKELFKKLQQTMLAIRRDPSLYVNEVRHFTQMFRQEFTKVTEATQKKNQRFGELTIFLSRCCSYYTSDLQFIAEFLQELLSNYGEILHPYIRRKAVSGLMILRSRNMLPAVTSLQFLINLFRLEDKPLRKMLYHFVLHDLQRMNKHRRNNNINRQLQNWMHDHIKKHGDRVSRKMLNLAVELFRKDIWSDSKCVNMIASGCFSSSQKVRLIASYFLLSTTEAQEESESQDEQVVDPGKIKLRKGVTKSTKGKEKQIEREKRRAQRKIKNRLKHVGSSKFLPIDMLFNPQEFGQKLYGTLSKKDEKFTARLVYMSLLSRLIHRHQLIITPFYSYLQKFMNPGQKDVGKVLACFCESVHSLVSEEELHPIVKHIIENFVNDRCTEIAMTMGLNTLRQLFIKNPLLFDKDTVGYISTYYEYKNKNVTIAAKSFINAVRQSQPDLLERKLRGRLEKDKKETESGPCQAIDGADLLGQDREIPVFLDRILTDEDFRRIRILKKKKELLEEREALRGDTHQIEQQQQSQEEGEQLESGSQDAQSEDEWQTVKEGQSEEEQQQADDEDGEEEADEDGEEESELDWQNAQELPSDESQDENPERKESQMLKKQSRKRKPNLSDIDSDEIELSEDEPDDNGFMDVNKITFYKKSKGEVKAQKRQQREEEGRKKFVHKPKEKGGGTNDREKLKNKPLMMIRPKKNKLRMREKQVKTRIKDLKNQLGRVRSGLEAKKMKNKKLKK